VLAVKLGNDYDVNAVEEAVRLCCKVPKIAIQSYASWRKSGDAAAD
jgi:hypothetical protein